MKIAAHIAATLLGLVFIAFSLLVLLHLAPAPNNLPPLAVQFMTVFATSGWLIVVKICELIGGILVIIPKTRNFGLLFLGPIIINICSFHLLVEQGGFFPIPLILALLAAFLLFVERNKFAALAN